MIQHESLKSYIASVQSHDDLSECMEPAFSYQFMFERKTSPWEMSSWNQDELQNFKVETEKIDRVYYVKCSDDDFGSDFYLLCRMKHGDKHVFVEFAAGCDYTGFDCQGGGDIYVTSNPNTFYNEAIQNVDDKENHTVILKALLEDGYQVEPHQESRMARIEAWNNPITLQLRCLETIRDNQDARSCYSDQLPKPLTNSIDQFIGVT